MNRTEVKYSDHFAAVMSAMTGRGLLLGSYDAAGKANIMTIGLFTAVSCCRRSWPLISSPARTSMGTVTGCTSGKYSRSGRPTMPLNCCDKGINRACAKPQAAMKNLFAVLPDHPLA